MRTHDEISFALSPEGTRKFIPELRTGFYHIARGANIPIYMVGLDFEKKAGKTRRRIILRWGRYASGS